MTGCDSEKQRLMEAHDINEALADCYLRCRHLGFVCYGCPLDIWCEEIDMGERNLKIFSSLSKDRKLVTMWRIAAMLEEGEDASEIARELDIPAYEVEECIKVIREGVK